MSLTGPENERVRGPQGLLSRRERWQNLLLRDSSLLPQSSSCLWSSGVSVSHWKSAKMSAEKGVGVPPTSTRLAYPSSLLQALPLPNAGCTQLTAHPARVLQRLPTGHPHQRSPIGERLTSIFYVNVPPCVPANGRLFPTPASPVLLACSDTTLHLPGTQDSQRLTGEEAQIEQMYLFEGLSLLSNYAPQLSSIPSKLSLLGLCIQHCCLLLPRPHARLPGPAHTPAPKQPQS